jgi:hypothetical protein
MCSVGTSFVSNPSPAWQDLKFNAAGLLHLRQKFGVLIGEPGAFKHHEGAFEAAEITWFAAGMHKDGSHFTSPLAFHTLFHTAREHSQTGDQGNREQNAL